MRIHYHLNWMGPVSMEWYENNNIPYNYVVKYSKHLGKEVSHKEYKDFYSGGTIDISGVPGEPYGVEYSVPIMHRDSWMLLGSWLKHWTTTYLPEREEILSKFETQSRHKINWFKGGS